VEFESRIVRQELREHVRLMNPSVERGKRFVSICGWCKKIALPNGQWVEVEEAVRVLNLFHSHPTGIPQKLSKIGRF